MAWLIAFVVFAVLLVVFDKARKPSVASKKYKDSPKYRKLLGLVGGDRSTADRLADNYGIDKAIADLERDRRFN